MNIGRSHAKRSNLAIHKCGWWRIVADTVEIYRDIPQGLTKHWRSRVEDFPVAVPISNMSWICLEIGYLRWYLAFWWFIIIILIFFFLCVHYFRHAQLSAQDHLFHFYLLFTSTSSVAVKWNSWRIDLIVVQRGRRPQAAAGGRRCNPKRVHLCCKANCARREQRDRSPTLEASQWIMMDRWNHMESLVLE